MIKKQHTVTFYSPGTFFPEETTKTIDAWDLKKAVELSETVVERYGAKPFRFRFATVLAHDPIPDGQGGHLRVEPREIECSCLYYLGGEIREYDEIAAEPEPEDKVRATSRRIMLSNMRQHPIIIVNENSYLNRSPFEESDQVVDSTGTVVRRGDEPDLVAKRAKYLARFKSEA